MDIALQLRCLATWRDQLNETADGLLAKYGARIAMSAPQLQCQFSFNHWLAVTALGRALGYLQMKAVLAFRTNTEAVHRVGGRRQQQDRSKRARAMALLHYQKMKLVRWLETSRRWKRMGPDAAQGRSHMQRALNQARDEASKVERLDEEARFPLVHPRLNSHPIRHPTLATFS